MKSKLTYNWNFSTFKKTSLILFLLFPALFVFADRYSHLELFAKTLNLIKINYFKPIKIETLVYGAIKGLLKEIDPHSHFLLPEDFEILQEETKGQFYGSGIEVEKKEDFLIIISVFKNSPAEKAGLKPGDKIFKIDNKIVKSFNTNEFRHFFKTSQNKFYKMTILRAGYSKPLIFRIKPDQLKIQSVDFKEVQKGLFYIRIYYFSEKTFLEANTFLKGKKINGLLLDLRGNPGGIFEQSVKITDLFLNEGLIVSYKIKTEKEAKKFSAHYSNTLTGSFPLVVLIDEYSASGSEIVAGALKDHKRAVLIGRKTFGKGSIQKVFHLKNKHALKLTVGEYRTPSGKFIHKKGIEPDIKIDKQSLKINTKILSARSVLKDPEIYKAFHVLKNKSKIQ